MSGHFKTLCMKGLNQLFIDNIDNRGFITIIISWTCCDVIFCELFLVIVNFHYHQISIEFSNHLAKAYVILYYNNTTIVQ